MTKRRILVTLCLILASVFGSVQAQNVEITASTTELTCNQRQITLTAKATGFPEGETLRYRWAWSLPETGTGSNSNDYTSPTFTATAAGVYVVTVESGNTEGEMVGANATIEITDACNGGGNDNFSVTITAPTTTLTCDQRQITLTANVTGLPENQNIIYNWYINGTPIEGVSSATYNATQAGTYYVKPTNTVTNHTVSSEFFEITDACNSGNTDFTVEAVGGATAFSAEGGSTTINIQASSDIAWVATISKTGSSTIPAGEIGINPTQGTGSTQAYITLSANNSTESRIYAITFAKPTTMETLATLRITQDGQKDGYIYGCTDPTATNYNPNATANDGSCIYDNTFSVTITAPTTTLTCSERQIRLTANVTGLPAGVPEGTPLNYQWTTKDGDVVGQNQTLTVTQAGEYTVGVSKEEYGINYTTATTRITDACNSSNDPFVIINAPTTVLTCEQTQITLTASVTGFPEGQDVSYRWAVNGSEIAGIASATYTATEAGTYTVVVQNEYGAATNQIEITGGCNNGTDISLALTAPTTILTCEQPQITLTATVTGVPNGTEVHYRWLKDNVAMWDELQTTATTTGNYVATYTVTEAGSYTVRVSSYQTGISIANDQIYITGGCSTGTNDFTVTATKTVFPAEGGLSYVTIEAQPFIPWVATITNADGSSGAAGQISINPTGGTSINTQPRITVNPNYSTESRAYTITFARQTTMETLATLTITQEGGATQNNPTVTITAPTTTLTCDQRQITLTANATNFPEGLSLNYRWLVNGSEIAGVASATYTVNAAGTYVVIVEAGNEEGEMVGASDQIQIIDACNSNPDFIVTLTRTHFPAQGSYDDAMFGYFNVVATSEEAESISWTIQATPPNILRNDGFAQGTGSTSVAQARFYVPNNTSTEPREFILKFITNGVVLYTFTVTQDGVGTQNNPTVTISAPTTELTCEQRQITLTTTVTGVPEGTELYYQWLKDNVAVWDEIRLIPTTTGAYISTYNAEEAGTYTVKVDYNETRTLIATRQIEITDACNTHHDFTVTAGQTAFPAQGGNTTLNIQAPSDITWVATISSVEGSTVPASEIRINPTEAIGNRQATLNVSTNTSTAARAYLITFRSRETMVTLATLTITQEGEGTQNNPTVTISAPTTELTCEQRQITLIAYPVNQPEEIGVTFKWLNANNTIIGQDQILTVTQAGIYTVIMESDPAAMAVFNATSQIQITDACNAHHDFTVTAGQTAFSAQGGSTTLNIQAPSDITWVATISNAEGSTVPASEIGINPTEAIGNRQATLNVSTNTSTAPRVYLITFARQTTRETLATLTITQEGAGTQNNPLVTIMTQTTEITCEQRQITLTAAVTGVPEGTNLIYRWLNANNNVIGQNQSLTVTKAGIYFVMVSNEAMAINVSAEIQITGSCDIPGCTDPYSESYNPEATVNDGSCVYKTLDEPIEGCTDPESINYNPVATIDDGSCIEAPDPQQPIYGCTDRKALNYNPNATDYDPQRPDCQCIYANEENIFETEVEETPVDTIGTKPIENCALKINVPIIEVSISSVELLSPNEVLVNWVIKLEGGITILYAANYTVNQSGPTLFYLSIICKEGEARVSKAGEAGKAGESTSITGFTVSASYNVNLGDPVGIYPPNETGNISVYPNPTSGIVNINNPLDEEVYIYTLSGTLIGSVKGNRVDLSKQPVGVYVLRIGNKATQSAKSVRIIKK